MTKLILKPDNISKLLSQTVLSPTDFAKIVYVMSLYQKQEDRYPVRQYRRFFEKELDYTDLWQKLDTLF